MNAENPSVDPVMARIGAAQQQATNGERDAARQEFAALWDEIGVDGDALHRVSLAHYMADVQDDPAQELEWDLRALAAAESLTDDRVADHHESLAVRGFYPSLYLNLGADYEKLDRLAEAREYLGLAETAATSLPDGGYGDLVRSGIAGLRERLTREDG